MGWAGVGQDSWLSRFSRMWDYRLWERQGHLAVLRLVLVLKFIPPPPRPEPTHYHYGFGGVARLCDCCAACWFNSSFPDGIKWHGCLLHNPSASQRLANVTPPLNTGTILSPSPSTPQPSPQHPQPPPKTPSKRASTYISSASRS